MEKTIFFILGSIFFGVATIAIFIWLFYCLKILRNISKISWELKEKVEGISNFIKIFINLFEKLVTTRKNYGRRKRDKEELG